MNILSVEGVSKSYSERILFKNISLGINEGDKIGLIGINGTGKSTFMKIIAGVEGADEGGIIRVNGLRIAYLSQNPVFKSGVTVLQYVTEVKQEKDNIDVWTIEHEAKNVLTRLGITDFNADVSILSGGQQKRVAIAEALIHPADLLILDEPTNHIDNDTIDYLEKYLQHRNGALLMVTHDRYFLDRVTNRIVELDNGNLYCYQGNYSYFLEKKMEREASEASTEQKRQTLYKKELEWIKRGAKARTTKQKARIDRFEKLKEEQGPKANESIEIKSGISRLGKKIIEIENVNKVYNKADGELRVINDFSYIVLRDDRIGIIGINGVGKSTLLKIIAGILKPDSGNLIIGETVKLGYFSQDCEEMNGELRVIEYIKEEAEYLKTSEGLISASQMLERFLFPPDTQWTPISKLSGGEKRRLYLLRVLMGAPNVLLLDEPTNDLDIQTLTILESYLDDFSGAVIAVSHDRYFLDRIANKIFAFDEAGRIDKSVGNYSDFYQRKKENEKLQKSIELSRNSIDFPNSQANKKNQGGVLENDTSAKMPSTNLKGNGDLKPLKFSYKEQREYEQIDDCISALEKKIDDINIQVNDAASDFTQLQELLVLKDKTEKELEILMERWVYLNELAEEIEKNRKNRT